MNRVDCTWCMSEGWVPHEDETGLSAQPCPVCSRGTAPIRPIDRERTIEICVQTLEKLRSTK